jgi:hypothetical protein
VKIAMKRKVVDHSRLIYVTRHMHTNRFAVRLHPALTECATRQEVQSMWQHFIAPNALQ